MGLQSCLYSWRQFRQLRFFHVPDLTPHRRGSIAVMNRERKDNSNGLEHSSGKKSGVIRREVWYYHSCCTLECRSDDSKRTTYYCHAKSRPNLPQRIC